MDRSDLIVQLRDQFAEILQIKWRYWLRELWWSWVIRELTYHMPAPQKANHHPQMLVLCIYTISTHKANEIHVNKIKNRKQLFKYKQTFLCVFLIEENSGKSC